jgi:serine/threonine protein kinase
MVAGRPIFDRANASDGWYKAVIENKWPLIWKTLENQYLKPSRLARTTTISAPLRDLLEHMLSANPNKRLTISQIKQHPWFMNTQKPDLT